MPGETSPVCGTHRTHHRLKMTRGKSYELFFGLAFATLCLTLLWPSAEATSASHAYIAKVLLDETAFDLTVNVVSSKSFSGLSANCWSKTLKHFWNTLLVVKSVPFMKSSSLPDPDNSN